MQAKFPRFACVVLALFTSRTWSCVIAYSFSALYFVYLAVFFNWVFCLIPNLKFDLVASPDLYNYLIAFTMITVLKKTREKNTFEKDTKTKDEGAGHTTERGSKLSVPLRKIHKY